MSYRPPSPKQLRYLEGLGYRLTPPVSSGEAHTLLTQLEEGMSPEVAERKLLEYREGLRKHRREETIDYLRMLAQWNREYQEDTSLPPLCSGFRGKVFDKTPENEPYDKVFLPLDVARAYPELIMMEGIDWEERKCRPKHGKFIEKPGQGYFVKKLTKEEKKERAQRDENTMLMLFAAVVIVILLVLMGVAGWPWAVARPGLPQTRTCSH